MSLPVEVLLGIYLGLLAGVVPALVAGTLGFVVKYVTGVTLPGLGVVVLALSMASVNGGLLGLLEPEIANSPRLLVAVLVILMLALYAHSQGDKLGAALPKRFSLSQLRQRTLSADAIEIVGGIGQVTVEPRGEVEDMEGYPSVPAELRAEIRGESWRLPADLPLAELERRLEERLVADYGLTDALVTIDERGRATIAVAPPAGRLSKRIQAGTRAVSVDALVPTGLARGELLTVETAAGAVDGSLVSARSAPSASKPAVTDGGQAEPGEPVAVAPTTDGGEGRVTVAVPRREASTLLAADRGRVVVRPRGTNRAFELLALFRRAGYAVEKLTVRGNGALDGSSPAAVLPTVAADATVLAVRWNDGTGRATSTTGRTGANRATSTTGRTGANRATSTTGRTGANRATSTTRQWTFVPGGDRPLGEGDELFVVGPRRQLRALSEAAGR